MFMEYKITPKRKSDVQFNGTVKSDTSWATQYVLSVTKEFDQRFEKIKEEYEKLMDEVYWNNILYKAEIRFQPVIGHVYYLYMEKDEKYTVSLIAPWEWGKENFIGSFKFEHNGKWYKTD
jgi:hypothetical protein